MRFSTRYKVQSGISSLILEDAPRPTRVGFLKGVLGEFVGSSNRHGRPEEPLETTEIHEKFIALIRDESDPWDYDQSSAWNALTEHLKSCSWMEFYDFVELVGTLLIEADEDPFSGRKLAFFQRYQSKVNELFAEDAIGWRLDENAQLVRQMPQSLAKRMLSTERGLGEKFEMARMHYRKATKYITQHPIDEANGVKEIVSALESVAKVLEPECATLGDAIKVFKRKGRFPKHLLDAMEKLYVYSNATPLVRHGHTQAGGVSIDEAELALHIGIAFIRFLISSSSPRDVGKSLSETQG
jgi:hypothetical protein